MLLIDDSELLVNRYADLTVAKFNPDQPRVPAGSPAGGEWGGSGGGDWLSTSGATNAEMENHLTEATRQTLLREEATIVGHATETAIFVDKSGAVVLRKDGVKDHVLFTNEETASMRGRGVVMTHNHPSRSSLSADDVSWAQQIGAVEIRAVTPTTIFRIREDKSRWPDWTTLRAIIESAHASTSAKVDPLYFGGKLTRAQANMTFASEKMKAIAKLAGLAYREEARHA